MNIGGLAERFHPPEAPRSAILGIDQHLVGRVTRKLLGGNQEYVFELNDLAKFMGLKARPRKVVPADEAATSLLLGFAALIAEDREDEDEDIFAVRDLEKPNHVFCRLANYVRHELAGIVNLPEEFLLSEDDHWKSRGPLTLVSLNDKIGEATYRNLAPHANNNSLLASWGITQSPDLASPGEVATAVIAVAFARKIILNSLREQGKEDVSKIVLDRLFLPQPPDELAPHHFRRVIDFILTARSDPFFEVAV